MPKMSIIVHGHVLSIMHYHHIIMYVHVVYMRVMMDNHEYGLLLIEMYIMVMNYVLIMVMIIG